MVGRRRSPLAWTALAAVSAGISGAAAGCSWSLEGFTDGAAATDGASPDAVAEASTDGGARDALVADAAGDGDASPAAFLAVDPPMMETGGAFDLTALGDLDWAQWKSDEVSRCRPCTTRIGALLSAAVIHPYGPDDRVFSWSNGKPAAASSSQEGIYIEGVGSSFQLQVDADPAPATLTLHVDNYASAGLFTVHMDGVGLAPQSVTVPVSGFTAPLYAIKVHFSAPRGTTLQVEWKLTTDALAGMDAGDVGNIAAIAATLSAHP